MPHIRERYARSAITEALRFSPLVGVFGQRQVGKTTLVENFVGGSYYSFDDDEIQMVATSEPRLFLNQFSKLTALDECQKVPRLFPALKLLVQRKKQPGQFLLTGSVRFTSRRAIEESLTGRIYSVEMLPLTVSEMKHEKLDNFVTWGTMDAAILQKKIGLKTRSFGKPQMAQFLSHGGLPGICFLRKVSHRNAKFKDHLATLLQRDIRMVIETTVPYQNILSLLRFIASRQGKPFILKEAASTSGISPNSVKKLVFAFESMFLIRRILGDADRTGDVFYFEDQGMASYLTPIPLSSPEQRFAFSQLYAQAHYHFMNEFNLTYFETKGGAYAPFVFHINGKTHGFILNPSSISTRGILKSTRALLSHFPNIQVYILSSSDEVRRLNAQVLQLPLLAIY